MRLYESDISPIVTSDGNDLKGQNNFFTGFASETETGLRRITEQHRLRMRWYDGYVQWLKTNSLYSGIIQAWLISPSIQSDFGKYFIGSTDMTAVGSYNWDSRGISGDAISVYFKTNYNVSGISDINNFSIFLYVDTNTNAGTDFGADDTTNALIISTRDSNVATFTVGTASDTFANTNSIGVWCLNVRAGEMYVYKNGEIVGAGGTGVAGSLPNLAAYLSCYNDNGGDGASFSSRKYSYLSIHNGAISEAQVGALSLQIEILQNNLLRGHGIS